MHNLHASLDPEACETLIHESYTVRAPKNTIHIGYVVDGTSNVARRDSTRMGSGLRIFPYSQFISIPTFWLEILMCLGSTHFDSVFLISK